MQEGPPIRKKNVSLEGPTFHRSSCNYPSAAALVAAC